MTATRLLARPLLASDLRGGRRERAEERPRAGHQGQAGRGPDPADAGEGRTPGQDPRRHRDPRARQRRRRRSSPPSPWPAVAHRGCPAPCSPPRCCPRRWPGTSSGTRPTPSAKANQKIHFFKNLSMLGGLILAAVDTEGRPGVAWRAKHAATGARREARHVAKQAKLEARARREVDRPTSLGGVETRPEEKLDLWPAPVAHGPVDARVELPGSKSLTNRALVLAALADGPSRRTARAALARHRADGRRP